MDPIRKLMDEHRVIETVLAAIPPFNASLDQAPDTARADLAGIVTFIREYADAYHHGKEEDLLFTAMADAGMPTKGGPIAVMLAEHAQGRAHVAVLRMVADGEGPLSPEEVSRVRAAGAGYHDLLRAHIMKEDQVLYPMATRLLPPETMAAMAGQFDEYEARHAPAAGALAARATGLAARFVAERPA